MTRVGVVDCGTNSTRLLVAERGEGAARGEGAERVDGAAPRAVMRTERVTGLGRGRDPNGRLQPEAIDRVCAALSDYREVLVEHDVERVRAVATSAARDAPNRDEFIERASDALGTSVETIDGDTEAALSFAGASVGLAAAVSACESNEPATTQPLAGRTALVVDIGGGSTELAVGTLDAHEQPNAQSAEPEPADQSRPAPAPTASRSITLGSVSLTERFLTSDPPRPEELSAAISFIRSHLSDIDLTEPAIAEPANASATQLVGVGGSMTTIAAVECGLASYRSQAVDGFALTRAAAEDTFRTLATEPLADRVANPGLPVDRAPVIVGGCCVLVAIMRHWSFNDCVIREADLTDALAAQLLGAT